MKKVKVLVACEESQTVCKAFRERGHEAYSCDIQEPSGGHPEWHIHGDVLPVLRGGCVTTMDGERHEVGKWDLVIAHPPCTFLTVTGNSWFNKEKYGEKAVKRERLRTEAFKFFMEFANMKTCERVAIENPIGYVSTYWKKPTQIIQPYQFGDDARKATCLWLKNLPPLKPTKIIRYTVVKTGHGTDSPWHAYTWNLPREERAKARSKTFPGIANAMADQWGNADKEPIQMDIFDLLKEGT